MRPCTGLLVLHEDGEVAYCTDEAVAHPGAGGDHDHSLERHRTFVACRLDHPAGCPRCRPARFRPALAHSV